MYLESPRKRFMGEKGAGVTAFPRKVLTSLSVSEFWRETIVSCNNGAAKKSKAVCGRVVISVFGSVRVCMCVCVYVCVRA